MKTLIIPDVHENLTKLKTILSGMEYDRVIFLGDWFDKFGDNNSLDTAKFLLERIKTNEQDIFILGNHDLHYFSDLIVYRCSGFSKTSYINVNSILKSAKNKFKLIHIDNNIVFSHAGIVPAFQRDLFNINMQQKTILQNAFAGKEIHRYLEAGLAVGGSAEHAGIVWARPSEMRFDKPEDHYLNQIFGHTPKEEPRLWEPNNKFCLCLDTHLNHWALLDDEVLQVWSNKGIIIERQL